FAELDVPNNKYYVTWLNCPTYAAGGSATVQVELNLTTGAIEYRYQGCVVPEAAVVGWTPGTPVSVRDPGNRDISTTLPGSFATSSVEVSPLTLSVSPAPVLGTPITYTSGNVPATSLFTLLIVSLGQQTPGLDLGIVGAPGCQ